MAEEKATNEMIEKSIKVNKDILDYLIKINKTNRLKDLIIMMLSAVLLLESILLVSILR